MGGSAVATDTDRAGWRDPMHPDRAAWLAAMPHQDAVRYLKQEAVASAVEAWLHDLGASPGVIDEVLDRHATFGQFLMGLFESTNGSQPPWLTKWAGLGPTDPFLLVSLPPDPATFSPN
jgi:hypothetical protein